MTKHDQRISRHRKIRAAVNGSNDRPRVSLYRGLKYLYAQAIDDTKNQTIFGQSSKTLAPSATAVVAKTFGEAFGKSLIEKKIKSVVFDRSGFRYHGQIQAFVEGLRTAGITV